MRRISHANRGLSLERLIELSNQQYRRQGLAVVHKVPTHWVPLRGAEGKITGAKVAEKAAVDFLGCVAPSGRLIAFDAKQNRDERRFPLDERWSHEVAFLQDVSRTGGITFLLIEQVTEGRICLLPGTALFDCWTAARNGGRRSIPVPMLRTCPEVPMGPAIPVHYLPALRMAGYDL